MKNEEWGFLRGDLLLFRDVSLLFKEMLILKVIFKSIFIS